MAFPSKLTIAAVSATAAAAVFGGGYAFATTKTTPTIPPNSIHGCVATKKARTLEYVYTIPSSFTTCPKGTFQVILGTAGNYLLNGSGAPSSPADPGDFYLDTTANTLYGPYDPTSGWPATGIPLQGGSGKSSNTILNGTGAPSDTLGNDGDFYLDTSNNKLWGPKAAGAWPASGTSLVGPAGKDGTNGTNGTNGNTILNGTGAPASGLGSNGDFYLDTSNETLWGPKAGGSWPGSGTSLIGPAGTSGSSHVTVTAQTAVTNWPESSGWANDNFTRVVNITRQHAAASANCGGTPTCWFYTATLTDNGTFTTMKGATAPNASNPVMISGIVSGSMIGGGDVEFYASSGTPDGTLVPVTADGSKKPDSTTNWVELAFPQGTTFNGVKLTQYKWVYSATSPNTCEVWTDQINPGDDGQGAADGNITGVNACT